jgi:hypothetical protein
MKRIRVSLLSLVAIALLAVPAWSECLNNSIECQSLGTQKYKYNDPTLAWVRSKEDKPTACDSMWRQIAEQHLQEVHRLQAENAQLRARVASVIVTAPPVQDNSAWAFLDELKATREQQQRQWQQDYRLRQAEAFGIICN